MAPAAVILLSYIISLQFRCMRDISNYDFMDKMGDIGDIGVVGDMVVCAMLV